MTDPTPEKIALWTRLMAEAEGWTKIHYCTIKGCDPKALAGLPPDDDDNTWHIPDYRSDLNALQRVCVEICKTVEGDMALHKAFVAYWQNEISYEGRYNRQACLPASELFPIVGSVLEQLTAKAKENENG